MRDRRKFDKRGALCIAAASWGLEFEASTSQTFENPDAKPYDEGSGVAVIEISGPLTHHQEWLWDSYDAIKCRAEAALASQCRTVILKLDSPGGDASGCFELSRELRKMAAASGKRLIACVDGMAASAAYAIACAADEIYVSQSSYVGSVGCITILADQTAMDRSLGLNIKVISSGARKADGNPHVEISEDTITEVQSQIDSLAELFFALVSDARGLSVESVSSLEAALFHGGNAVEAKLATGVLSFDEVIAAMANGSELPVGAINGDSMKYEELMAALKKMAEGEGDDADKAKKMLAAMEEDKPKAEDEEPKKKDDEEPKAEADGADAKAEKEPDGDEPPMKEKASAKATNHSVGLAAQVMALSAEVREIKTSAERSRLLASRPDLMSQPSVKAWLSKASIETVREAVASIPKPTAPKLAAATTPAATRGEGQTGGTGTGKDRASRLPPDESLDLKRRMGLATGNSPIARDGNHVVFGVMTPDEAKQKLGASAPNGGSK